MRWYRAQMFEKLVRFKHVVVILISLFVAPLHLFDALFVQPIINIGYVTQPGRLWFSLLLTQFIYLGWILFQGDAISSRKIQLYLTALPIPAVINRIVDLVTLVVANNIFLIPMVAALIKAPYAAMSEPWLFLVRMLVLISSILVLQFQWINRRYQALFGIMVADVLFYMSSVVVNPLLSFLFMLSSLAIVFMTACSRSLTIIEVSRLANSVPRNTTEVLSGYSPLYLLKLTYSVLVKKYFIEYFTRSIVSIAILTFGIFAILFGDALNAKWWSMSLMSFVVLSFSGLFPLLKESREQYQLYMRALPISQSHWYLLDFSAITLSVMSIGAIYMSVLYAFSKLNRFDFSWIIISSSILTLLLFFIRNQCGKFNALIAIIATVSWVALMTLGR